jgi:hypothetical protein
MKGMVVVELSRAMYWVLGTGYWAGYWVLGTGYWVLGTGYFPITEYK